MKEKIKTLIHIFEQETKDGQAVCMDYCNATTSKNFEAVTDLLKQAFEKDDELVAAFLLGALEYFKQKGFKKEDCIDIFSTMTEHYFKQRIDKENGKEQKILFPLMVADNKKYKN